MAIRMPALFAVSSLLLSPVPGLSRPQAATEAAPKHPETLLAEITALKPANQAWREIAWKTCPLEALKEAREKKRPVLAWVFLGNPADERC